MPHERQRHPSVHDLGALVFDVEVRDLESTDCLEHTLQDVIARAAARARRAKFATELAQQPQHACPIEPLSLTVFAKAHDWSLHRRVLVPSHDFHGHGVMTTAAR
jgi:hypothetical protein